MARIRIARIEDAQWSDSRERYRDVPAGERAKFGDGELDTRVWIHHPGDGATPQLVEIVYKPNATIQTHAHDEDEIIVVTQGEAHIGNQVLRPGSSIFIAGRTLYGFTAGPDGLTILNFRPRQDLTFIPRDEFLKQREADRSKDKIQA